MKIEKEDIEVLGKEWKEGERGSWRAELLRIKYKGNEVGIPITKIDNPEFGEIWDADWIYLYMDVVVVEKFEDGEIKIMEYEENDKGELEYERSYKHEVRAAGKEAVAAEVIWSRE